MPSRREHDEFTEYMLARKVKIETEDFNFGRHLAQEECQEAGIMLFQRLGEILLALNAQGFQR